MDFYPTPQGVDPADVLAAMRQLVSWPFNKLLARLPRRHRGLSTRL